MDDIRRIDAQTARRFLVERHLLTTPRSLEPGLDGVRAAFGRLGSVQFDPLGVAGRNHDLVLHARVRDYQSAWTDTLLYETRELFEAYNKGLSLLPTAELPWYRVGWDASSEYRSGVLSKHADAVAAILERIRLEGPLSSLDFERKPAIEWWWGPTSEARALLEALSASGIIGLSRREGNRRYFDLMERLMPPELLALRPSEHDQRRHKLLSRYRAHGLLGATGSGELWYGTGKGRRDAGDSPETPSCAASCATSSWRTATSSRWPSMACAATATSWARRRSCWTRRPGTGPRRRPEVTFLAALDPFVWDRDLLRILFDFDYVWEVYVPEHKRRWGYYVLPILFGDRLVGRIEPRIDRAAGTVRVLGLWWEEWFDPRTADGFVPAMRVRAGAPTSFGGVTVRRVGSPSGRRQDGSSGRGRRGLTPGAPCGLLEQQLVQPPGGDAQADEAQHQQVDHVHDHHRVEGVRGQAAQQVHAPVQGRDLHERPERLGIGRDGEERGAEQEQRQGDDEHQVEVLPAAHERGRGRAHSPPPRSR